VMVQAWKKPWLFTTDSNSDFLISVIANVVVGTIEVT